MIITFDYNSDLVYIDNDEDSAASLHPRSMRESQDLLVEIFNKLNIKDITIEKIDEDVRTTIEEW